MVRLVFSVPMLAIGLYVKLAGRASIVEMLVTLIVCAVLGTLIVLLLYGAQSLVKRD